MTSPRQIEANRRNAAKSTGPTSEEGKQRSRYNAVRHGLTAETVVQHLEDSEDYKTFELSVTADFDVRTAVERELVLRLASLLWRLRRATAIETGVLQIQSSTVCGGEEANGAPQLSEPLVDTFVRMRELAPAFTQQNEPNVEAAQVAVNAEMAARFLVLNRLDSGVFERLNRYEAALWRQVCQLLVTLEFLRRNQPL